MTTTKMNINRLNAGIIHTQARMEGLSLEAAIAIVERGPLQTYHFLPSPHLPTIKRFLKAIWAEHEAEKERVRKQRDKQDLMDAAVAAAYPAEWANAAALTGRERRETKRLLRLEHKRHK
jgi:hypothetical protein